MFKKNNGVTLMQMIGTIIIIIILASFAIWYSANTSTEAKLTRLYTEISMVKEACRKCYSNKSIKPRRISYF